MERHSDVWASVRRGQAGVYGMVQRCGRAGYWLAVFGIGELRG